MTIEKATAWRNEPAINTPITRGYVRVVDAHTKPREGDVAIKDGKPCMYRSNQWAYMNMDIDTKQAKTELKPQICTCCLAPLPANSNTCEYCGTTYR